MTKRLTYISFLSIAVIFMIGSGVTATTGGPNYVSKISLNGDTNTIYYLNTSYSGRGCPPIINSINVSSGKLTEITDCNDFEGVDYEAKYKKHEQEIDELFSRLPAVPIIDLGNNDISFHVQTTEVEETTDEKYGHAKYLVTVAQDGIEKGNFEVTGCLADQMHSFEGHAVPNIDKLAILHSSIGYCAEGGYVEESLHLIFDIEIKDSSSKGEKGNEAALTSSPNILAIGQDKAHSFSSQADNLEIEEEQEPTAIEIVEENSKTKTALLFGFLGALLGIAVSFVGYLIYKKHNFTEYKNLD